MRNVWIGVVALWAGGCSQLQSHFFSVETETERICKAWRSIVFPASPPGQAELSQTLSFPLGEVGGESPPGRLESELRLRFFQVRPAGWAQAGQDCAGETLDLDGVEYASVSLRRPGSTEIIRTLLAYQRMGPAPRPCQLTLSGVEPVSVPQMARDNAVDLVVRLKGELPQQEWTVDLEACGGLRTQIYYFNWVF